MFLNEDSIQAFPIKKFEQSFQDLIYSDNVISYLIKLRLLYIFYVKIISLKQLPDITKFNLMDN